MKKMMIIIIIIIIVTKATKFSTSHCALVMDDTPGRYTIQWVN
jgi:hypothetical protein